MTSHSAPSSPLPWWALIGAPGAGKSTWARAHFTADAIVSTDRLRTLVCGDPGNMDATPAALRVLDAIVDGRLAFGQPVVVDATHGDPWQWERLFGAARRAGRPVNAIVFDTPLNVCLARNATRTEHQLVPEPFIRRTHASIAAEFPTGSEQVPAGFDHVVRITHGQADPCVYGTIPALGAAWFAASIAAASEPGKAP